MEVIAEIPQTHTEPELENVLNLLKKVCKEIGLPGLARSINLAVYLVFEYKVASTDDVAVALLKLLTIISSAIGVAGAVLGPLTGETRSAIEKGIEEEIKKSFVKSHAVALVLSFLLLATEVAYVFAFPLANPEAQTIAKRILGMGFPIYTCVLLSFAQFNEAIAHGKGRQIALVYFLASFVLPAAYFPLQKKLSPYDTLYTADAIALGTLLIGGYGYAFDRNLVMSLFNSKYWKAIASTIFPAFKLGLHGALPAISQLIGTALTIQLIHKEQLEAYLLLMFLPGVLCGIGGPTCFAAANANTVMYVHQYPLHPAIANKAISRLKYVLQGISAVLPIGCAVTALADSDLFVKYVLHGETQTPTIQETMRNNSYYAMLMSLLQIFVLIDQGISLALAEKGSCHQKSNRYVTLALTAMPLLAVLFGFMLNQDDDLSPLTSYLIGNILSSFVTLMTTSRAVDCSKKSLVVATPSNAGFFNNAKPKTSFEASPVVSNAEALTAYS